MAGSLQVLQSACPEAAGLLDDMCSNPEQWFTVVSSTDNHLPHAWQQRLSTFQQLLLHKVLSRPRHRAETAHATPVVSMRCILCFATPVLQPRLLMGSAETLSEQR